MSSKSSEDESSVGSVSFISDSDADDSSSSTSNSERHERFMALRAQHYLMKEALQQGRHLVESEEDE